MRFATRCFLVSLTVVTLLSVVAKGQVGLRHLESQNPIPQEFRQLSSEKYESSRQRIDREREGRQRTRDKEEFLLESNFVLSQLLSSGRVLFNDTVSRYLSRVLDRVLESEPELRAKVRVYALRSTTVNAFTTDDGILLVSLALLAQLESEAQLAFILCHELVHFEEEHVINSYVQGIDIREGRGIHGRSSFDDRVLAQGQYSKELERQADVGGLERYLRAGYPSSAVNGVFDVLRYAHLPFDEVPFDREFFNAGHYSLDESLFLEKVRMPEPVDAQEKADATHPAPSERQAMLRESLAADDTEASRPPVDAEGFLHSRDQARMELVRLYLFANRPVRAIYTAFLKLRKHPDDPHLHEVVARSLYMLAKYKLAGRYGSVHPGFSGIEGESQQLYHLLYRLQPDELAVLALGYIWRQRIQRPDDADLATMADDLLEHFMLDLYVPGMFSREQPTLHPESPDTSRLGKYDRLRIARMGHPRNAMMRNAFVDLFSDSLFTAHFDRLEKERWMSGSNAVSQAQTDRKRREEQRKWRNSGHALGIDSVVMVSPAYLKLDLRKRQKHRFLDAEWARMRLHDRIDRNARLLGLHTRILETTLLDSMDAQTFNDIAFLNEWVDQRLLHMDVDMVSLDRPRLDELMGRYGASHFSWTGIINYRETKPLMYFYLLYALVPPAIPLAIYYLVRPNFDTYFYSITFDLRTGEPAMIAYSNFKSKDAADIVNSNLYDAMWQMKTRSKARE